MRLTGQAKALPLVGSNGGLSDLTAALREYGDQSSEVVTTELLVAAGTPVRGYAHVLRQDLVNPDLLFLGTELGLWISLDGGRQWAQYKGGDVESASSFSCEAPRSPGHR